MRCKIPEYCDEYGSYVVVTDFGVGDRTDFIMSPRGYSRLGRNPDASAELFKYGVVEVEYRRIPCRYKGYNIVFKVHENSKFPDYIAVAILYVGGQNDVTAVELWQVRFKLQNPFTANCFSFSLQGYIFAIEFQLPRIELSLVYLFKKEKSYLILHACYSYTNLEINLHSKPLRTCMC